VRLKPFAIVVTGKLLEEAEPKSDQSDQNDARPLRPAPGKRRRFSAGEAHVPRISQWKSVVDEFHFAGPL
jgi:hypothetical protein